MVASVLAALGIIVTITGALLISSAARYPGRQGTLERWGGGCFVAGLAMIVIHFPMT
jgi:hypothetical protein